MKGRVASSVVGMFGAVAFAVLLLASPAFPQARGASRPKVQRPEGDVWRVIRTNCISCHGIDDYAFYSLDRDGWTKLLADKHKDGSANISADDTTVLLDYLVAKFGPTTKPFPRAYVPQEITTFFSDPEAYRLMNRSCTVCHDMQRISTSRFPEEEWRVKVLDMRERGAKISDDELEHLVEWLGRVWGTNQDK